MRASAEAFKTKCNEFGFSIEVKSNVVSITKKFEVENTEEYLDCEELALTLMDMVPLKGGSIWGTTSDTVGSISALKHGRFVLNKSGFTGKRFINALSKII